MRRAIVRAACATAILLSPFAACGGAGMTPADTALVGAEGDQERQCIDRFAPDAAAQNECRAMVRAEWDRYWTARFDGGEQ